MHDKRMIFDSAESEPGHRGVGHAIPPSFNTNRISLLDRGWACAIAHIRGGDDLGYQWFLDGKLEKRTNTFNDFVDVAKGLIAEGFTHKGGIGINGGSAGGELMLKATHTDWAPWTLVDFNDQRKGRLTLIRDLLDRLPDTKCEDAPIEWKPLGHKPLKEKFGVLRPIADYPVG